LLVGIANVLFEFEMDEEEEIDDATVNTEVGGPIALIVTGGPYDDDDDEAAAGPAGNRFADGKADESR
jgi:hypothetical protein